MRDAVFDVLPCGEMRKESWRLEKISEASILRGNIEVSCAIEEKIVRDNDAAFVGRNEAGNAIEKSGFSGARRAEEDSYPGRNGKVHVKMECATREASADAQFEWI